MPKLPHTGSHDDESTTSSHALEEAQPNFQQHLAAWLTVCDRKIFLKAKVEGLQATGADLNSTDVLEVVTESKTTDIEEHRAYTPLNDWIQDNDTDGTLAAKRDTALQQLDPLLEERNRLIDEVIRTYNVLQQTATNSSGAVDPTYDALKTAHQHAKDDRFANDALIRGTLESHRAEPGKVKKPAKQRLIGLHARPRRPPLRSTEHAEPARIHHPTRYPTGQHFQWRQNR